MRTLDLWLTELATEAAAELARRAERDTLSGVNERDHLQPSCTSAARAIARTWTPLPQVSTSFGFSSPMWPRVGRVDIALLLQDEKPIAVELKCGTGRDALGPCAWDALKLAFGLQAEEISAGYLLTATTTSDWAKQFRGAERAGSLADALRLLDGAPQVFVIGGAELFAETLSLADELLLTEIDAEVEGDTFFPSWDRAAFHEESREQHLSETGIPFSFVTYLRRPDGRPGPHQ